MVGCVLAALAIVALVAFVVARKKYDSVRTTEAGPEMNVDTRQGQGDCLVIAYLFFVFNITCKQKNISDANSLFSFLEKVMQ